MRKPPVRSADSILRAISEAGGPNGLRGKPPERTINRIANLKRLGRSGPSMVRQTGSSRS